MSSPAYGANLFGGRGFWTFAILASIIWGMVTCSSGESQKAGAAKETSKARSLATQSSAIAKCESWTREVYSGGRAFSIVKTDITRSGDLTYYMDVTYRATAPIDNKAFTNTENCNVVWDYANNSWKIRAR